MTRGIRRLKALGFPCTLLWQQNGLRLGRMGADQKTSQIIARLKVEATNVLSCLRTHCCYTNDCVATTPGL